MRNLDMVISDSPYIGYAYSYPHKSAYRTFDKPIPLETVWADERDESLFLYLHVPFCEYRCGFCNLFTLANATEEWVDRFLSQLANEASAIASILSKAQYARIAIGGGTPTFLDEGHLEQLLSVASGLTLRSRVGVPTSCEASPATLTESKARILRDWGVDRLSLGIQTFDDQEARTLGRPQTTAEIKRAIDIARRAGFPVLNLDLIYGADEQSFESWMRTVRRAICHAPEEVYIYPLYISELTGLGRTGATPGDDRLAHYRGARELLLEAGYEQRSMRMFCKPLTGSRDTGPLYCCQSDGMVGLGCGARSYTRDLHYSSEFAVGRTGIRSVLGDYLRRSPDTFRNAYHGYRLNLSERKRRFVIKSLLQAKGLSTTDYECQFGANVFEDLPGLTELLGKNLGRRDGDRLTLTEPGLERSDAIGPWLYSPEVTQLMEAFQCV